MCSTPPPIATSWTPEAISAAAKLTACWAEPHWRSTVVAGTSIGRPASSQALRPMLSACSPNCWTQPAITSPTSAGSIAGALDQLAVGLGEQVRGVQVLVVALLRWPRPTGVRTASTITTSRPSELAVPVLAIASPPSQIRGAMAPARNRDVSQPD